MTNKKLIIVCSVIAVVAMLFFVQAYVKIAQLKDKTITVAIDLPPYQAQSINIWGRDFDEVDEHCLALNIYFEARGEVTRGQYAVADVVLYRLMHANYPDTICEVIQDGHYYSWNPEIPIKHMCQFSWWCDGKSDKPVDIKAFEKAIRIAREVLHDPNYIPEVEYALFYHASSVDPHWVTGVEFVETIGDHSFYYN